MHYICFHTTFSKVKVRVKVKVMNEVVLVKYYK